MPNQDAPADARDRRCSVTSRPPVMPDGRRIMTIENRVWVRAVRRRHRRWRLPASAARRTDTLVGTLDRGRERRVVDVGHRGREQSAASRRSDGPGPRPRPSRSGTSSRDARAGARSPVSSPATDIVKQPPCAAASSSSGLVLPSGCSTRDARLYGSPVNAPVPAEIAPAPRARFPSQTTSATRSIRGTSVPPARRRRACRRGSRPRRASRPAGRRRTRASPRRRVFSRQWTRRAGRWTHDPGASVLLLAVDVEPALALEHVEHLVVAVEVVGRASRRDEADELRHRHAAHLGIEADAELPRRRRAERAPRGRDRRRRGRRRAPAPGRRRAPRAPRRRRRSRRPRRSLADEDGGAGLDAVLVARDGDRRRAVEDVERLVGVGVDPLARPAGAEREDPLRELLAAAGLVEEAAQHAPCRRSRLPPRPPPRS